VEKFIRGNEQEEEKHMIDSGTATLKEIVTDDFRAAAIFERYSLDFCCRGGRTVEDACIEKEVDKTSVLLELHQILQRDEPTADSFSGIPLSQLTGHIVATHHAYVRKMVPVLLTHTQKVAGVHGANHPEVVVIAKVFEVVAAELLEHMAKEEQALFPYIDMLIGASERNEKCARPPFGTVLNPIRMMEAEHRAAGDRLYEIRSLSSNYTPPSDACTTYKVTYQELRDFEMDLHQHVHLENNILFLKAVVLEAKHLAAAGPEVLQSS
jgi:regulator of cell morphogenesis and NO signaling